jgi:hypothetical protein
MLTIRRHAIMLFFESRFRLPVPVFWLTHWLLFDKTFCILGMLLLTPDRGYGNRNTLSYMAMCITIELNVECK